MKDFLDIIRDTKWRSVQLWLGWFWPVLLLFKGLFPKDYASVSGKVGEFTRAYGMADYVSLYPVIMKIAATGGVCALVTTFAINIIGLTKKGNTKDLSEFHHKIGHLGVGLVNWYWLMLIYGVLLSAPVYWLEGSVFYVLVALGLWVGPLLVVLNVLSLLSPSE